MPPPSIRRPLTITTWLIVSLGALLSSPLILAAGALASALTRRPQPLLLARLLIAYFARELVVLAACGWLWLATGCGARIGARWSQGQHNRLLRWFVHGLAARALELLGIEVASQPTPEAEAALRGERPLLYFSRHAGPGDTVLLVDLLLDRYGRVPSVVFKDTLAIDPAIDLLGHRLPHAMLDTSQPERCAERIEQVASHLRAGGVLLLFPEGGNFTPQRRRAAVRKLWRKGRSREASAGEAMEHVLPPHPTGAISALRGAPDADVVFGAHTGLGLAAWPGQLWRATPIGRTFTARMWLAPAADRPRDPAEQVRWLYGWWRRLDEWVDAQGQE
jgi:1-acyl-sn-glycerol-3-phosphate acyltransferase